MEGKDISGETVCSNDLNYTPHQLEGEETTSKSKGKPWHHKDNLKGLH